MPLKLCRSTQNICYMLSHEYFKGHLNSVVKLKSTKKNLCLRVDYAQLKRSSGKQPYVPFYESVGW